MNESGNKSEHSLFMDVEAMFARRQPSNFNLNEDRFGAGRLRESHV